MSGIRALPRAVGLLFWQIKWLLVQGNCLGPLRGCAICSGARARELFHDRKHSRRPRPRHAERSPRSFVKDAWRMKAATEGLEFAGVEEEALTLGLTPASIQGLEDRGVTVALVTNLGVVGMVAVEAVLVEVAEVGVEGLVEVALAAMVVTRATGARANLVLAATVVPMASTEVLEAAVGTTAPTVDSQLTR